MSRLELNYLGLIEDRDQLIRELDDLFSKYSIIELAENMNTFTLDIVYYAVIGGRAKSKGYHRDRLTKLKSRIDSMKPFPSTIHNTEDFYTPKTDFARKFSLLCEDREIKIHHIATELGVTDADVMKWQEGTAEPTLSQLAKLCVTLDISFNDLL